jgi:hypothetical protein
MEIVITPVMRISSVSKQTGFIRIVHFVPGIKNDTLPLRSFRVQNRNLEYTGIESKEVRTYRSLMVEQNVQVPVPRFTRTLSYASRHFQLFLYPQKYRCVSIVVFRSTLLPGTVYIFILSI